MTSSWTAWKIAFVFALFGERAALRYNERLLKAGK